MTIAPQSDPQADFDKEVRDWQAHIANGGTPPFVSTPAWEKASGSGQYALSGMMSKLMQGAMGGGSAAELPQASNVAGGSLVSPYEIQPFQFNRGSIADLIDVLAPRPRKRSK